MMDFEKLKKDLLDRARKAGACQKGYKMGLNSESKADLLKAITENWLWIIRTAKMIDAEYLEANFTEDELKEAGIYTRKEHIVYSVTYACGSATVEAYDSATVEAYDSATVQAYGSATVKACDNSYVENCTDKTFEEINDYSIVKDFYKHKIYIKKGKFEIVEIE